MRIFCMAMALLFFAGGCEGGESIEAWAQMLGEILPITHFLRIARGVMLKGMGFEDLGREVWPIALFAILILFLGVNRYRQTLD